MRQDLYHDFLPEPSFYPLLVTAIVDGDIGIDLQGFEGALIIVSVGAVADGSGAVTLYTFEVSECDTLAGAYTAVADADLIGTEPSFQAITGATKEVEQSKSVAYVGTKQYIRVDLVAVPTVPGTGGTFSGIVVKGKPRHAPAV